MPKERCRITEMARKSFASHQVSKLRQTFAWRCHRPGDSHYHFYVTWAPGMLLIGGDISELVVCHYSFADPWCAAAWINGASWSYFMEKARVDKVYDPEATAKYIIERAYCNLRDDARDKLMFRIVDRYGHYGEDDPDNREHRKEACRTLLSLGSEFEPRDAYDLTDDCEAPIYVYDEKWRWQYEGLKLWAKWMWENEPLWHKGVRLWWRVEAFRKRLKDLKRTARWYPVRYAEFKSSNTYGTSSTTSHIYHIFRESRDGGFFIPIVPLRLFGRTWDHLGFWETSYNGQKDEIVTQPSRWQKPHAFRDIRPGDIAA